MKNAILLLASTLAAAAAPAADYVLRDGNTAFTVSDRNGGTVWYVDQAGVPARDAADNLFLSSYFYRLGATGNESSFLAGLGTPAAVQAGAGSLSLTYASPTLRAVVAWTVAGGAAGSGTSTVTKSATITNLSAAAVDLHLFDYSDYDIHFDQFAQADQATLTAPGRIVTRSATVPFLIDAQVTGDPDHYQITDFITPYLSLFYDTDGPTTLSDTPAPGQPYPAVPRDNAFAFQWDRTLAPGQSFAVSQVARYLPAPVPEPATWATMVLGFGLAGAALRGRRAAVAAA